MDSCIETEKAAEVGLCLDLFRPFTEIVEKGWRNIYTICINNW